MTAARWCDRCKAYVEQPHDHPNEPSLFDVVEAEVDNLIAAVEEAVAEPESAPYRSVPFELPEAVAKMDGPGQARASDPDTSKIAAQLIRAKATSARVLLLEAHATKGVVMDGLIDEQAAELGGVSLASEYATRCSELVRMGCLVDTGKTRLGRAGAARMVRKITPFGFSILEQRKAFE